MFRKKYSVVNIFIIVIVCTLMTFVICNYKIVVISGNSMLPRFKNGTIHILHKSSVYNYNDVIVFKKSGNINIKRIVGLENDEIKLWDGKLYVNGITHDYYIYDGINKIYLLKQNEVFVLGDNTYNSLDSRNYGPISKDVIMGKIVI